MKSDKTLLKSNMSILKLYTYSILNCSLLKQKDFPSDFPISTYVVWIWLDLPGIHAIQEFASSSWNCHLQRADQSFFSIQKQFLWKLLGNLASISRKRLEGCQEGAILWRISTSTSWIGKVRLCLAKGFLRKWDRHLCKHHTELALQF